MKTKRQKLRDKLDKWWRGVLMAEFGAPRKNYGDKKSTWSCFSDNRRMRYFNS